MLQSLHLFNEKSNPLKGDCEDSMSWYMLTGGSDKFPVGAETQGVEEDE